jgi:hypothetical protein
MTDFLDDIMQAAPSGTQNVPIDSQSTDDPKSRAHPQPQWTTETPTEEGIYLAKPQDKEEIMLCRCINSLRHEGFLYATCISEDSYIGGMILRDETGWKWYGPIKPPEET